MNEPNASSAPRKGLLRSPWFWAAVTGMLTIPFLRPLMRHVPEPPPILATLPEFELVDQDGKPFGSAQLDGKVWVATFFFASCRTACPPLLRAAGELQTKWARAGLDVTLVSVTVDPENDTPERLRDVAREYGAKPGRWVFLTGPLPAVRALVVDGFATAMEERPGGGLVDIAHSTKFVLVDGERNIRGFYDSDEMGVDETLHRAEHVVREAREKGR